MIMSSRINQISLRNTTKSLQISNLNSKRGSLWVRSKLLTPKKIYHDVPVIENLNITIPKEVSLPFLELQDVGKRPFFVWLQVSTVSKMENFTSMIQKINNMEPSKRNIGLVFQNYAIFPHLTVETTLLLVLCKRRFQKKNWFNRPTSILNSCKLLNMRIESPINSVVDNNNVSPWHAP